VYCIFYGCNGLWVKCDVWSYISASYGPCCLYLCDIFIMEVVLCFSVVYMVSYRSMLVVWCVLGIYLVSIRGLFIILMGIIFYRGLIVVTILIVIPNGNAHYYYNSLVIGIAVVHGTGSIYLGVLTIVIIALVLVL